MRLRILKKSVLVGFTACAFACAAVAYAEEEETSEETDSKEEVKEEAASQDEAKEEAAPAKGNKVFFPLMRCVGIRDAEVEVMKPGAKEWEQAEEGLFYPWGTTFRISNEMRENAKMPDVTFAMGPEASVHVTAAATFKTEEIAIGKVERALLPMSGEVSIVLPRTLKPGLFTVKAPNFVCTDLAGESKFSCSSASGDGDEWVVRVVTGTLALTGRHYKFAKMNAADQIRIRTSSDALFTSVRGESGECKVTLDQGTMRSINFDSGDVTEGKDELKTLEFALSPKCAVKIWRAKSSAEDKMAVSVMTFDATGAMKNRCAYMEGRYNVNSGELVPSNTLKEEAKKEAESGNAEKKEDSGAAADEKKSDDGDTAEKAEEKSDDAADDKDSDKDDDAEA